MTTAPRPQTRPLMLIRPDGDGLYAVDWYDRRRRWQASELRLTRDEAKRRRRRLRKVSR